MALAKLIVGGFKSLKDPVEIPLAPITLLFGPNSAGKSVVRDALLELKRRLAVNTVRRVIDDRLAASLARLYDIDRMAHELGRADEADETTVTRVLLGCEDNDLADNGSTTMAAENEWTDLGRKLYFALQGRTVLYQFVDTAVDWTLAHELSVDGKLLMSHVSPELDESYGSWPELPEQRGSFGKSLNTLGLLRLNLAHPIAGESRLQALIEHLFEAAASMGPAWLDRVVWKVDDVVHIRVEAYRRMCQDWADPAAGGIGYDTRRNKDFSLLSAPLDALCFTVNELVRQVEFSLQQNLQIAHVSGSRTVLSDEMTSADWFSPNSRVGVEQHTVAGYAMWLGQMSIDKDDLAWTVSDEERRKDDFVNDCLAAHLFAARQYSVEAAVTLREEKSVGMIVPRDANWSTDSEWSMKSTLFLRDEQGRALNFSQVGSGVSYVMPVLTALWGASRSLIEQPELHLHPAAQCEVGDVIVRAFNRGRFAIVETHSEHLLLRILRRIRQTCAGKVQDRELQCQPEAVVVLYFAPQSDGTTQVHQLRVTRGGDFMDRWPDGFFEERSGELFDE